MLFLVKSFCDIFKNAYKNLPNNLSLAEMITKINEEVSKKRLTIAVPEFRMTKEIKFLPKNVSSHFCSDFHFSFTFIYTTSK